MKTKVYHYSFHNLLKLRIEKRAGRFDFFGELVNSKFSYFRVDYVEEPDIILEIGDFIPASHGCTVIDNKFHIRDNYLYYEGSRTAGVRSVEVSGFENGNTVIKYQPAVLGIKSFLTRDLLVQNILLLPLMKFKLGQQGYHLLHAGGVCKGDDGVLFLGTNKSFKSKLIIDLVKYAGHEFLGDDLVLVHDDELLSFPEYPEVFRHRYVNDRRGNGLSSSASLLLSLLKGGANGATDSLRISSACKLRKVISVTRTNTDAVSLSPCQNQAHLAERIAVNEEMDYAKLIRKYVHVDNFLMYLLAYSYVFPRNRVLEYFSHLSQRASKALSRQPTFELLLPSVYTKSVYREVVKSNHFA